MGIRVPGTYPLDRSPCQHARQAAGGSRGRSCRTNATTLQGRAADVQTRPAAHRAPAFSISSGLSCSSLFLVTMASSFAGSVLPHMQMVLRDAGLALGGRRVFALKIISFVPHSSRWLVQVLGSFFFLFRHYVFGPTFMYHHQWFAVPLVRDIWFRTTLPFGA